MAATLRRRILVNYRVQPERVEAMLPAQFRPVLVDGYAVAGICLIGLSDIRPLGLPAAVGVSSENAAHRVAVEWDGPQGPVRGVYIPRRDTSSLLVALAGGRAFPGWHRRADFDVESHHGRFRLSVVSRDGQVRVDLACRRADDVMAGSVFASVADASAFFRSAPTGYSATRGGVVLDGVELEASGWKLEPLHVETVASSFFEDREAFPSGAAVLDSAFVMENLATTWMPKPRASVTPRGASDAKVSTGGLGPTALGRSFARATPAR